MMVDSENTPQKALSFREVWRSESSYNDRKRNL